MSRGRCTFTSTRAARAIKRILDALAVKPMSSRGLADEIHLTQSSIQNYLTHLRDAPRRVRICGYEPGIGPTAPLYGLGYAPDEKRPPKRTPSDHYQALKRDPEKYQRALMLRRLSNLRASTAKAPHTWATALLGPTKQRKDRTWHG